VRSATVSRRQRPNPDFLRVTSISSTLQGVTAKQVQVQSGTAGHQNALLWPKLVVESLQIVAPTAKLVDFVEEPGAGGWEILLQYGGAMSRDVVIEKGAIFLDQRFPKPSLADLAGPPMKTILRARSDSTCE
jgi:hypothetical protein